jgi:hypothetical protein
MSELSQSSQFGFRRDGPRTLLCLCCCERRGYLKHRGLSAKMPGKSV